jgi:hypothetical protein
MKNHCEPGRHRFKLNGGIGGANPRCIRCGEPMPGVEPQAAFPATRSADGTLLIDPPWRDDDTPT